MRDITEIAKLIRADLKAAQKAGKLNPALRFSVRCSSFSGGQSLDVRIKGFTGDASRANPAFKELILTVEVIVAIRADEDGPRRYLFTSVDLAS